jgi:hypothetical protein
MAANYDLPENGVVDRVRFFDGQLLIDQDFIDDQKYHLDRQRRTNRMLRVSGICEGLMPEVKGNQVQVNVGTALDGLGQLIVLSEPRTVINDWNTQAVGESDIYISYQELPAVNNQSANEITPASNGSPAISGAKGSTRWREQPRIQLVAQGTAAPGAATLFLWLGRVKVSANPLRCEVTLPERRQYSGIYLPNGASTNENAPVLRSGGIANPRLALLTGDLKVDGTLDGTGNSTLDGTLTVKQDILLGNASGGGKKLYLTDSRVTHYIQANSWWTEFVSHSNEGWRFINTDDGTTQNERMRVTGSGNVGIGTTSPQRLLEVGPSSAAGTGTIKSAAKEVTGTGTQFTSELRPGDTIIARRYVYPPGPSQDQARTISSITSDTTLTTTEPFDPPINELTLYRFSRPALHVNGSTRLGTSAFDYAAHPVLRVASGTVMFDAPAAEGGRLKIDGSTGNVGIGDPNPTARLTVGGQVWYDSGTNACTAVHIKPTFRFDLGCAQQNGLIVESGNVGIGTTSPDEKLEVNGNLKANNATLTGTLSVTGNSSGLSDTISIISGTTVKSKYPFPTVAPGYVLIATYADPGNGASVKQTRFITAVASDLSSLTIDSPFSFNNTLPTGTTFTVQAPQLSVQGDGYVGFGTTTPSEKLEIQMTGTNDVQTNFLSLFNNGPGDRQESRIVWKNGADRKLAAAIASRPGGSYNAGDLRFQTAKNGSLQDWMIINADGKVGIGTNNPGAKLAINGGLHVGGDSDPGDNNLLVDGTLAVTGNSTLDGTFTVKNTVFLKGSPTATGLSIDTNGNVGIGQAPSNALHVAVSKSVRFELGDNQKLSLGGNGSFEIDADGIVGGRFIVKNDGKVGIGTNNPGAKLAINGGLHVGGDSDPGDNNLLVDGELTVTGNVTTIVDLQLKRALKTDFAIEVQGAATDSPDPNYSNDVKVNGISVLLAASRGKGLNTVILKPDGTVRGSNKHNVFDVPSDWDTWARWVSSTVQLNDVVAVTTQDAISPVPTGGDATALLNKYSSAIAQTIPTLNATYNRIPWVLLYVSGDDNSTKEVIKPYGKGNAKLSVRYSEMTGNSEMASTASFPGVIKANQFMADSYIMEKMDVIKCRGDGDWKSASNTQPIRRYFINKLKDKPIGTKIHAITDITGWGKYRFTGWMANDSKIYLTHNLPTGDDYTVIQP